MQYCHSIQREKKDQAIDDRVTSRLDETLQKLADGLQKKRSMKKYDRVMVKIGLLREKYSRASKQYTISVEKDETTGNAAKITRERKAVENTTDSYPGVYCLRTSHADWDESFLWNTYTMLTDLEAVFRSLKSELGLRPIHHQITDRVAGHLFITVLAYHLVQTIRFKLKEQDIHSSWSSIRKILSNLCRVTVSMPCHRQHCSCEKKSTRPEPKQQEIYSALGIKSQAGQTIKTTI
jgi:transposase